jgi:hypothetical protein
MKKFTHFRFQMFLTLFAVLSVSASFGAGKSISDQRDSVKFNLQEQSFENRVEKNFRIYPNPFYKEFFIENPSQNIREAVITDVIGKQVMKLQVNDRQIRINAETNPEFSLMTEGVYFLTLTKLDGNSQTTRIVKSQK